VKSRSSLATLPALQLALTLTLIFSTSAWATSSYRTVYSFAGAHGGASPQSGLAQDTLGNLYGTTTTGGPLGHGVVFKLAPQLGGGWSETVLYNFSGGADGGYPVGGLIFDGAGNLYGTAVYGGNATCNCGVVFKLTPQLVGSWTESVLYTFSGSDGDQPEAGLVLDSAGNLYGTTIYGGGASCSCGVVFKLAPRSSGGWIQTLLHTFTGVADGGYPSSELVFDRDGNLYGTASGGGSGNNGVVFELAASSGVSWTETVLHTFTGADGSTPYAGVVFDGSGNLYGTTVFGGNLSDCRGGGCGVVYELTSGSGGVWTETVLHAFLGSPALQPFATLVFDSAGNLYSTATGGVTDGGAVFKLAPQSGGTWAYSVLHAFTAKPGEKPYGNLILDHAGNLYGTAYQCGVGYKCAGLAFEITP
jgi:uncharacterized repeat protein (TIGR03803 family)